ncbi:MAG: TAXI family TRAP transporter solute-binding subunit [Alphaproteobacteria bacterium]
MFHRLLGAIIASLLVVSVAAAAPSKQAQKKESRSENKTEMLGIVTGPKTGTYFAFGKDIASVAEKIGISMDVKASEGSIDNIKRINSSENAALGIVQSDVLGFLARSKSPDSIRMASNLRMIFPFYNEEVHVLARKTIKSFSDLDGKKIAIGEEGSGNMLTAINMFSMMNVTPADMRKIPPAQGVVAVLKGELDAVVYVAGKPVRLFKNLEDLTLPENHKYAPMLEQVHFLPMDNPKMLEEYKPAEITKADYNFVGQKVPTVAVQAVMVSFDFSEGGNKKRCERLTNLGKALRAELPALKEKGHPKWKEVNLDAELGLWKKDSCVWPSIVSAPDADKSELGQDLINIIEKNKQ